MRKHLKRFAESGIETVYQYIWGVVITVIVAALFTIWNLSGPGVRWHYLYYITGFLTACLFMLSVSAAILVIDRLRRRTNEAARNAKFLSHEKGVFDHAANKERALKELIVAIQTHTDEINRATATHEKTTRKASSLSSRTVSTTESLQLANWSAARLDKHAQKLERILITIRDKADALIESDKGLLKSLRPPTTEAERNNLNASRLDYLQALESTQQHLLAARDSRDSQLGLKGFSQNLNSAVNRMVGTIDDYITVLNQTEQHWQHAIRTIDKLLI